MHRLSPLCYKRTDYPGVRMILTALFPFGFLPKMQNDMSQLASQVRKLIVNFRNVLFCHTCDAKAANFLPPPNFILLTLSVVQVWIGHIQVGLFQKKSKRAGLRTYFFEKDPQNFKNLLLYTWKSQKKIKLQPWKFYKIVLHPLEFPRSKTKTHGNSTWFFLDHPGKFHFFFIDP